MSASWNDLTERTLREIEGVNEQFRPTNFWGPGLRELLHDLQERGLEEFKRWPTASFWFYPLYGDGYSPALSEELLDVARTSREGVNPGYFRAALSGSRDAWRDHDVASAWWNTERWPFDLRSHGESRVGRPPQAFPVTKDDSAVTVGRAYNNYLLVLAALSQHVDAPPSSFLEIGGGFGALGEILMSRDENVRYVDADIPPLLTVASWYLTELVGDRVTTYLDRPDAGPLTVPNSGVVPNYRLPDLEEDFEVFVNSFSFQEMEPDVVENYVDLVCGKGIRYAVSLNSREGKQRAAAPGEYGALDPVTSERIAAMFARHGFEVAGRYNDPYVRSAGELLVMKRRG